MLYSFDHHTIMDAGRSDRTARIRAILPATPRVPAPIVFKNFRLFDGRSHGLREGLCLRVEGNLIKSIMQSDGETPDEAQIVDCGGRVIMPGLIDAHWHALFAALPADALAETELGYLFVTAAAEAQRTLLRGFTTVRDCGGMVFALKDAIDTGIVAGPRIFPSGAMITTTGGHDMRCLSGGPAHLLESQEITIADSTAQVQLRAREQLTRGASQLKIVGGGGVLSARSPMDMSTFRHVDLRAAVEVAVDWNTYVTVHAYTPSAIRRAVAAGAACIEHGHLLDEATARILADSGIWLSIQPLLEEDWPPLVETCRDKMLQVIAGTDIAYNLARAYNIKTAFGSDLLFSADNAARQGAMLTHLTRWYDNAEILAIATAANGELLGLSNQRNPYPGKLGVIEEGALADILLVDGNPLDDIALIADPERYLLMIMKDGKIYKDTIDAQPMGA